MGGTSGALYNIFLTAAYAHLTQASASLVTLGQALEQGTQAVQRYGGAQEGFRTMLDAMGPAVRAFNTAVQQQQSLGQALEAVHPHT